jgi:hypothetical protein
VPSQGEWNRLLIAWAAEHPTVTLNDYDDGYKYLYSDEVQNFRNDFLLPLAGYRDIRSTALSFT